MSIFSDEQQRALKVVKDLIRKDWVWQNDARVILNRADGAYSIWIDEDDAYVYKVGDEFVTLWFGALGEFLVYAAFAYRVHKDKKLQYKPSNPVDDDHSKFMSVK